MAHSARAGRTPWPQRMSPTSKIARAGAPRAGEPPWRGGGGAPSSETGKRSRSPVAPEDEEPKVGEDKQGRIVLRSRVLSLGFGIIVIGSRAAPYPRDRSRHLPAAPTSSPPPAPRHLPGSGRRAARVIAQLRPRTRRGVAPREGRPGGDGIPCLHGRHVRACTQHAPARVCTLAGHVRWSLELPAALSDARICLPCGAATARAQMPSGARASTALWGQGTCAHTTPRPQLPGRRGHLAHVPGPPFLPYSTKYWWQVAWFETYWCAGPNATGK